MPKPPPLAPIPTFPALPSFADLPHRWRRADARSVLAAVDASGLSPTEFAHATGVDLRRIFRWRERLQGPRAHRPSRSQAAPSGPIRLVELVTPLASAAPTVIMSPQPAVPIVVAPAQPPIPAIEREASLPVAAVPDPPVLAVADAVIASVAPSGPAAVLPPAPVIDVTTPGGWQLRVPGVLLAELVHALSARSC